jgi:ketosteroid isomerase-like protein
VSSVSVASAELVDAIEALEAERIRALIEVDLPALDAIYDERLVHVHAPGLVQNKAQLLEHTATRRAYREISRGELTVNAIGDDVAVVTGSIRNRLGNPDGSERTMDGVVTQVVHRDDDGAWRFVSFQLTPLTEQVWGKLASEQQAETEQQNKNEEAQA